jgi:acetyl-CoA C-acetyltransferase
VILGWARSPVAPRGGALAGLDPHGIGAPVVRALLARAGVPAAAVDLLVAGNALGAGGNPARMVALAAGLPDACAALSVDTQCCAGLDAVALAAGLLASGGARIAVAGGVEAWSRSPIRQHRPRGAGEPARAYDRPAFAPDPARDPDLPWAAARLAAAAGIGRAAQDAFAIESHARARAWRSRMADEIVPIAGLDHDPYARALAPERVARMPVAARSDRPPPVAAQGSDTAPDPADRTPGSRADGRTAAADDAGAVSRLAIAPQADGAAFVLLATPEAARALGAAPRARWRGAASTGCAPEWPMRAALAAARTVLRRAEREATALWGVELHEAFAVQALDFRAALGLDPARMNRGGGGLGRGHPIGASGAISLVRLLADMRRDAPAGAHGLATIAGAGGVGAAALVQRL